MHHELSNFSCDALRTPFYIAKVIDILGAIPFRFGIIYI